MQRSLPTAVTMLAAATITGPAALGQVSLDPPANYTVGSQPSGIAFGDFDGDGDVDAATMVDGPDRVQTLLNTGTGAYVLGPASFLPASSSPQDVVSADFDGNGTMDLAIAVRDPLGSVLIMSGTGAGMFTVTSTVTVGDRPRGLSLGDLEGDGDMDIAVANRNDDSAHVITNNGGSFSAQFIATGGEPRKTILADFDGDGDKDLAVTNHDDRSVGVYTNSGGAFALTATLSVGPFVRPEGIDSGDVDNDGDMDLAVGVSDNTLAIYQVMIFTNAGGAFGAPIGYDTGGIDTGHVVLADLDCDGLLDAAATNLTSANISVLRGTGGGAFGAAMMAPAGAGVSEIAVADIDGDGDIDLGTANRDANSVTIFGNATDCAGGDPDIDGDGDVDFSDLLALLASWGDCAGCPADIDGDGTVGFSDLLIVLASWT